MQKLSFANRNQTEWVITFLLIAPGIATCCLASPSGRGVLVHAGPLLPLGMGVGGGGGGVEWAQAETKFHICLLYGQIYSQMLPSEADQLGPAGPTPLTLISFMCFDQPTFQEIIGCSCRFSILGFNYHFDNLHSRESNSIVAVCLKHVVICWFQVKY